MQINYFVSLNSQWIKYGIYDKFHKTIRLWAFGNFLINNDSMEKWDSNASFWFIVLFPGI